MRVFDCRKDAREPGSIGFPCCVRIIDTATGVRIPNVFYAATSGKLGRFVTGPDGEPMADSRTRRRTWHEEPDGRRRMEFVWDRLEVWEIRPWAAVSVETGECVAKSEDCP